MVIPLLGVKMRCADKSTAEHYGHKIQYIAMVPMTIQLRCVSKSHVCSSAINRKNAPCFQILTL